MEYYGIGVNKAPTDKPNTDGEKTDAEQKPPPPTSESKHPTAPPPDRTNYRRRYQYCYTRDPAMLGVAFLTFLAVVIYAYYAAQQVCAANKTAHAAIDSANAQRAANEQAREAFEISRRPEVNVGRPDGKLAEFRHARNRKQEIVVYFSNSGR